MKKLRLLFLFALPLVFASCTDTREELEIKANGSGTLVMKSDLSKMLEMVKNFGGENDLSKDGLDRAYDTTLLMKDYVDTAKDVPADKKELLRNGKVHVIMNVKESIGKFDMSFPFTSPENLQKLYASLGSSDGGLKNLFGGMGKGMGQQPGADQSGNDKNMPQIASAYDIVIKNGLYSRKVNKERYDAFAQAMKLDQLKQMSSMLGDMDYTLSVTLPRPVKKVSNSKATVSDDKKTVTLKTDLMQTFEQPELLALDIEY